MSRKFRPESDNIQNLFQKADQLFQIPPYQRRYSWGKRDWNFFWKDLFTLDEEDIHFLSTIVVIPHQVSLREPTCLEVVDGQQRLATFSLMVCALRDFYRENGSEEQADYLNRQYLYIRSSTKETPTLKIQLGNLDSEAYENIIRGHLEEVDDVNSLKEAYSFFKGKFENMESSNDVGEMQRKFEKNTYATVIHADDPGDAHRLFETLNYRGIELTHVDLIKNHLFKISSERDEDLDLIKRKWTDIIRNLEGLKNVRFFRQYLMSSRLLSEKDDEITEANISGKASRKLYDPFKEITQQTSDLEAFLRDIDSQSKLYKKLRTQRTSFFDRNIDLQINNLLEDIEKISKTPFTFFLRLFREGGDPEVIIRIIQDVISLMVRRSICGLTTAPHDKIFNHLAQNAFESDSPLDYVKNYLLDGDYVPDNDFFKENFAENSFRNNDKTRYYLSSIEEKIFSHGRGKVVTENTYDLHIEHILPKRYSDSLEENWLEPYDINRDEHGEYKKRIGNLTLLESGPNISARQRTLQRKHEYYESETEILMTQALTEYNRWGIEEIEDRSQEMADYATEIWNIS